MPPDVRQLVFMRKPEEDLPVERLFECLTEPDREVFCRGRHEQSPHAILAPIEDLGEWIVLTGTGHLVVHQPQNVVAMGCDKFPIDVNESVRHVRISAAAARANANGDWMPGTSGGAHLRRVGVAPSLLRINRPAASAQHRFAGPARRLMSAAIVIGSMREGRVRVSLLSAHGGLLATARATRVPRHPPCE